MTPPFCLVMGVKSRQKTPHASKANHYNMPGTNHCDQEGMHAKEFQQASVIGQTKKF